MSQILNAAETAEINTPLLELRPIQRTKTRKNGTRGEKKIERHEEEEIYFKKKILSYSQNSRIVHSKRVATHSVSQFKFK